MSTNTLTSTQPRRIAHQLLSTPDGTLIEILASPEEVGDGICLLRGTVPPGVAVPLHSHADLELFYVWGARLKASSRRKVRAEGRPQVPELSSLYRGTSSMHGVTPHRFQPLWFW